MLDSGDFYEVDYRMLCKGGQYIWIHDIGKRVQAEDGRPVALSVCYDISDQVRLHQEMEQAAVELQGKNRELKELANNIPGGVVKCIFGGDLRTIYLSEGFCRMLGYSAQEIALGGSFYDFLWEEDRTRVQSELERAAEDICAKGSSPFFGVPSPHQRGLPHLGAGDQAGHFGGRSTVWVQCADGYHRPP